MLTTCFGAGPFPGTAPVTVSGLSCWLPAPSASGIDLQPFVQASSGDRHHALWGFSVTVAKRAVRVCGVTTSALLAFYNLFLCSSVQDLPAA